MRGMAIILVVLGHIVAHGEPPPGNHWFWDVTYWIYHFHMPLFMYLSGLTFFLFQKPIASSAAYSRFLAQRAVRLLPALFFIGIVVVVAKYVLAGTLHVDNSVQGFWSDILKLFYDPLGGALTSLWFVYTLFVVYVVSIPLLLLANWNPNSVLVAGAVIHFVPLPDYLCLSRVGEYLLMFGLGCVAASHVHRIRLIAVQHLLAFLVIFVAVSALIFVFMDDWNEDFKKLVLGLASLPVAHGIAMRMRGRAAGIFTLFGVTSLIIYLLNTIFIGLAKAILLRFFHSWDGAAFLAFLPILLFAGTLCPVVLKLRFLRKYPVLDQLTG
jgi:fucose 4-O-acetylase-like acetyltransferase